MSEDIGKVGEAGILSPHRIEALTDGVFAIVMTLLVLELAIDTANVHSDEEFLSELGEMWNEIFSYILTFLALGVFWLIYRYQCSYIIRSDGIGIWLTIFFLTTVALYPFTNSLLAYEGTASIVLYAFNALVTLIILAVFWWYASSKHRLLKKDTNPRIIRLITYLTIPPIIGLIIASALAFLSVLASIFFFMGMLIFMIVMTAIWSYKIRSIEERTLSEKMV